MRWREFLGVLGGAAAALPLVAHGQERVQRVGILMGHTETDQDAQDRLASFRKGLEALEWIEGRNVHIEGHYAGGGRINIGRLQRN